MKNSIADAPIMFSALTERKTGMTIIVLAVAILATCIFCPIKGYALQLLAPSYGTCGRCKVPWKFVGEYHTTPFYAPQPIESGVNTMPDGTEIKATFGGSIKLARVSSGCFPLCENCWQKLGTPEKRWPYYESLMKKWHEDTPHDRSVGLREAVFAGL